jgi:hypothetical protein
LRRLRRTDDATTKPTRRDPVGYQVYACSGRNRKPLFWPKGMTPTDKRPRWMPARCPQKPIKREVIDTPAGTFFELVGLDLHATRASITQAHDARRDEYRALREQAEREARKAEARLAHVKRDYQDGKLAADDWNEQRDHSPPSSRPHTPKPPATPNGSGTSKPRARRLTPRT